MGRTGKRTHIQSRDAARMLFRQPSCSGWAIPFSLSFSVLFSVVDPPSAQRWSYSRPFLTCVVVPATATPALDEHSQAMVKTGGSHTERESG